MSSAIELPARRDAELIELARSILVAAINEWGDGFVTEPNAKGDDPAELYTETHFALAAVLLALQTGDREMLDVSASRLRLWNDRKGPMTFFNAMAVCLTAIVIRRAGTDHAALSRILTDLLSRAREHRHVAYTQWCGNNAYLQQVAVDTLLLPLAREQCVTAEALNLLVGEFRKYRTSEGFFYDLPRNGRNREPLCPPTYIMKMLFLAGACHELHQAEALADLFRHGMSSTLPLLSREGHFSYFGRTDNSPFEAGLTIFNLRKAAQLCRDRRDEYEHACANLEQYLQTFPRTSAGMLQSNRFGDAASLAEMDRSRDDYAYVGQYSISACAYALLGSYWFPASQQANGGVNNRSAASSNDLGVVKLRDAQSELVIRTGSQVTSWDRRYLGPTILRYQVGDRLLVGAISRTVSTDQALRPRRQTTRVGRACGVLRDRFADGLEQLDGTSVGFVPVLRRGFVDLLPYQMTAIEATPSHVCTRYRMLQVHVRGFRPCLLEAVGLIHNNFPRLGRKQYTRPAMRPIESIELARDVFLEENSCRIEDCVSGDLNGKTLLFSVRHLATATVRVRGLRKIRSMTGWGSDGRQSVEVYEGAAAASEIRYGCDIEFAAGSSL